MSKYATLREIKIACSESPFFARKERKMFGDQKYHVYRNHLIICGIFTSSNGYKSSRISIYKFNPTSTDKCPLDCVLGGEDCRNVEQAKQLIRNKINGTGTN